MPILADDIKLLKSAVMADTSDGGGAMTGIVVVDGQSNNLFPDTSAAGRAHGQVAIRLVYGVAHTDDNDTLLGSHAIITSAPADPLVHCALVKAPHWGAVRSEIQAAIEKYLVKGPKLSARLYDTHYAGSLQIRLLNFNGSNFPAGGEGIVLINSAGKEQYVRVLKVAITSQQISFEESGNVVTMSGYVAVCDLGQELAYDFDGPPAGRLAPSGYTSLFSTTSAGGTKFYGIKPLSVAAAPGDASLIVSGGIYTPVVPAATNETPIIDQFPLQGRGAVVSTGYATLSTPSVGMSVGPNTVITAPTAIAPKSVNLLVGSSTTFTDNGSGGLLQGTTVVGTVDYAAKTITFGSSAPNYGNAAVVLGYTPACASGVTANSASLAVTQANQGLAYTASFFPVPAPGSFTLGYMAQGRWYDLTDDLNGKLAGADNSYGVGNLSYLSGSMSVTLGAIPDVGSQLLAQWGDPNGATKVVAANLATKVGTVLPMNPGTNQTGITVTWSRGATNYSATTNGGGVLVGDATGRAVYGGLQFEPSVFPDGDVEISSTSAAAGQTSITASGVNTYQLSGTMPVHPGTIRGKLTATYPSPAVGQGPHLVDMWDLNGVMYANLFNTNGAAVLAVGTVNYTSGVITMESALAVHAWINVVTTSTATWNVGEYVYSTVAADIQITIYPQAAATYAHAAPATDTQTLSVSSWNLSVNTGGLNLTDDSITFALGGDLYSTAGGSLRKGWNISTGAAAVPSAGAVSNTGAVTITSLPGSGQNTLVWYNASVDASAKRVSSGVFRTASAPLKTGVLQLHAGTDVAAANDAGVLSGAFEGSVDFTRGIVKWTRPGTGFVPAVDPAALSYNAVYLQYLPIDRDLLQLDTARLPLDGKVPVFRTGDLVVVHNTVSTTLPNPLTKGLDYNLGRERIASVRIKDALGVRVPSTLYTVDLNAGKVKVPTGSNITAYAQPFRVEDRIEDLMMCSQADISGQLKFTRSLTHDFPAGTSFVSSALEFGDLFSRAYNIIDQQSWTNEWSDERIGATILANFNDAQYPIVVTNRGAIKERWACIFTNNTSFRIVGENVGEIGTGSTATETAPLNPATATAYFSIPALGWGGGRVAGNVLRFNTDAAGAPFCPVRTVLQGPASLDTDEFTVAFRGDVDRP